MCGFLNSSFCVNSISKDSILVFKNLHNFLSTFNFFFLFLQYFFLCSKVKSSFMIYTVPCDRSFEYNLIKSYTPPMCNSGMNNFRIYKTMHKSSNITETNWVSWGDYHSCSTVLSDSARLKTTRIIDQNQTTGIMDWKQQNCKRKIMKVLENLC